MGSDYMNRPSVYVTIQARMGSTRLPGKVIMEVMGKPLLSLMIERLQRIPTANGILLCTTSNPEDDILVNLASTLGIECWRGSQNNVMHRVLTGAENCKADIIVETTGDCPLIDPTISEQVIRTYFETNADYTSNVYKRSFPIGMDTQVFSRTVLEDAYTRTTSPEEREHVSLYIYRHPERYKLTWLEAEKAFYDPYLRLTLDTPEDYTVIKKIFECLYSCNPSFGLNEILRLLKSKPHIRAINANTPHNWVNY